MIDSRVDLPQPDGPAMATNSPLLDLEVDVGEGVGLDLVGEEDLLDARPSDERICAVRQLTILAPSR